MLLWMVTAAHAGQGGVRATENVAIAVGGAGALVTAASFPFLAGPEPLGFLALYPPGLVLLTTGTVVDLSASLVDAHRSGADPTAGWVGVGLLGAGVATFVGGAATSTETESGVYVAIIGAPVGATAALVAGAVQGHADRVASVAVLPDPARRGLLVVGEF